MRDREETDLDGLCKDVWNEEYANVTDSARETAISKANNFLSKRQSRYSLHKVSGEPFLRWE